LGGIASGAPYRPGISNPKSSCGSNLFKHPAWKFSFFIERTGYWEYFFLRESRECLPN